MDRSEHWGGHIITPVGPVGQAPKHFQIKCGWPGHNTEHACTKKRSLQFGGREEVLHCLKYWAALGNTCETAEDHLQLWNVVVHPAWKDGTLPPLEDLNSSVEDN